MAETSQHRVLLGVSGGIAAYKAATLVRRLRERGAEVRVVMTEGATRFVTPLTFQALSATTLSGDAGQWTLQLKPRRANVLQHVKNLELRGTHGRLHTIEILESRGERTVTHLSHDSP